jgi:hypothetical protein
MTLAPAADIRAEYGQAEVAITTAKASSSTCNIHSNVSTGTPRQRTLAETVHTHFQSASGVRHWIPVRLLHKKDPAALRVDRSTQGG